MEECYYRRSHVPAFGSWDWNDNLPFTQCFESATTPTAGFFRYTYAHGDDDEDRDLYVAGDLYQNDVVTPAMIVVPRSRAKVGGEQTEKVAKKQKWVSELEEEAPMPRPTPKPVDEDLYRISPELLYQKNRKKRAMSFFSSCLLPTCIA
ncbi:Pathogenic type III effector avirulence factor Avr cleavage site [Senna tora]|uniref:Pathogenic type III effector avirulence factor Avr cleavage site n=1 Tax=Senna tora TaxID=362788 RepID=A0A834WJT4_9FABA|nr:Pathogenic type III effector avirulence factor Avr cleavage site [Senna tora]